MTLDTLYASMTMPATLAASGAVLVSFWKPVILLIPIIGWAWLVSRVFDKHAAQFHLGRENWNAIHLSVAFVGVAVALLLPVPSVAAFGVALGIIVLVCAGDVIAFVAITNRDERVPEHRHLRLDFSSIREAREARSDARRQGKAQLVIEGPSGRLGVPETESPEFPIRLAAEEIYFEGLGARASQIDVVPGPKEGVYTISHLVDGVRQGARTVPSVEAINAIDLWKKAAGLDIEDRRRRLVGEVKCAEGEVDHTVRITTSGARGGLRMTMLFDPAKATKIKVSELGLLDRQLEELQKMASEKRGVVLLATPPHAGRTTLMYSIVRMHDAYTQNVQTVEIETQGTIEGVRQNKFDPLQEGGPSYATFVRSLLRRDPDVLAIADLPDAETAQEAARVDPDRARVYVCLKADNALQAIQVWCKAVGDLELAAQSLHGVVVERLVRRLCTNCRVPYQPSKEMLAKLGLPADKVQQLFKKGGQVVVKSNKPEICPVCSGVGYYGQIGLFEVYSIGDEERAAIRAGDLNAARAELRKRQLPIMHQAALRRAVEGVTSIEEITRVTAEEKKTASAPAAAAPAASPA